MTEQRSQKFNTAPRITPLDVLENFLGEEPSGKAIRCLTYEQLRELGDLSKQSANASLNDPAPPDTYYHGGWVGAHWQYQIMAGDLNLALLYYPQILVHDPLAEFFFDEHDRLPSLRPLHEANSRMILSGGPQMWSQHSSARMTKDDYQEERERLATIVQYISELSPLLKAGVLVCRTQYPTLIARNEAIMSSVRHDVRSPSMQEAVTEANAIDPVAVWDSLRGMQLTPSTGYRKVDEPWAAQYEFYFLAKTLAVADQAGAVYAPPASGDLHLLRQKARAGKIPLPLGHPRGVLEEVARLLVPDLQLRARDAVAIRNSEDAFDDWRRQISSLARDASSDSADEMRQRVEDALIPAIRRVEKASSSTAALKSSLRDTGAYVAMSALPGASAAALTGGVPAVAATAAAVGGVLKWLYDAYKPKKVDSRDAVLASLIRAKKDATKGPSS
ncbi:hypothetical protein [Geodermatophilus poikilotrophus]|uniref:Uncharacterized protein n=1 Tax=Geodermatophilus poikilotrophus TaxID=1333667 RepID=A0A1I0I645_9ACTN|nr:hypothetical protein [Geodermatophilus poikilotrophus]SET92118.1 hypothetical protein SAMN04488546_4241 [Geodermatophilus poikilotrophus]